MCWRKKTRLPSAQRLGPVPFDTQALHWCQRGHRRPLPRLRLGAEKREGRFPELSTADNGAPDGHELLQVDVPVRALSAVASRLISAKLVDDVLASTPVFQRPCWLAGTERR